MAHLNLLGIISIPANCGVHKMLLGISDIIPWLYFILFIKHQYQPSSISNIKCSHFEPYNNSTVLPVNIHHLPYPSNICNPDLVEEPTSAFTGRRIFLVRELFAQQTLLAILGARGPIGHVHALDDGKSKGGGPCEHRNPP